MSLRRTAFQHVKILREYCKKWHAVGGYVIFWFTREFCELPQAFHGRSVKIIMDIHTLLGIFKSLNQQRQAHRLYTPINLLHFMNPEMNKQLKENVKHYFARAVCQLRKLRTQQDQGIF